MNKNTARILAATVSGLLATTVLSLNVAQAEGGKVKCAGVNACKGKSACKTADHACKGQNACKGKGVTMMKDAKACTDKGGTVEE